MDSYQENKVDEDIVRGLSDRIFPGSCHHHDFWAVHVSVKHPTLLRPLISLFSRFNSGRISEMK
jgi:hypothetical protein